VGGSVIATASNPARLLQVEHAVAAALTEDAPLDVLLGAIAGGLGWHYGGAWLPQAGVVRCVAVWAAPEAAGFAAASRGLTLAPGEGLPGRVQASGEPAWIPDVAADPNFPRRAAAEGLHCAFAVPLGGGGALEFLTTAAAPPDGDLLRTLASLGRRIGQWLEHRESGARKRAVLDAALDAVITIDHTGTIVEANAATRAVFGHGPDALVGRELADVLVPRSLRGAHRHGLARGAGTLIGTRVETTGLHADGHEMPVELTITRIDVPGPPMYTGYVRDITERVRRQDELRASRARIVAAADEARRRLERDLHDGAQSRLLAVGIELKVIEAQLRRDPELAAQRLAVARAELQRATAELRELARGIHPAVLTELGLVPALRTLVRRGPLPVELDYDGEARLPAAVEATGYFLVAEALANVVRYARATRAHVRVEHGDGTLAVSVRDDGAGGADPDAGSGLRGMADRLAALGGQLEVDSPPGGGTLVRGVMPCAP
jgi:PAS domain S-box-containing protein